MAGGPEMTRDDIFTGVAMLALFFGLFIGAGVW